MKINNRKYPSQCLPIVNLFIRLQSYLKRNIVIKICTKTYFIASVLSMHYRNYMTHKSLETYYYTVYASITYEFVSHC